jgi:hypothetical protein
VPARPSGKGKAFGSGEGELESGAKREVQQGLTAFVHNFEFCKSLGRAALGEILMLIWGATFGRNFDVNIGRAA